MANPITLPGTMANPIIIEYYSHEKTPRIKF
jgi:hypothetical protein